MLATLAVVGDFWSMAVFRCAVYGMRRFGQFEQELGLASNVLADRLNRLVDAGILERSRYQERPPRYEYGLTEHAAELVPIIVALKAWGDRHLQEDGAWSVFQHRGCSSPVEVVVRCPDCGTALTMQDVDVTFVREI